MPTFRRTTTPAAPPPSAVEYGAFGTSAFYAGGFILPEGNYALEFEVRNGNPNSTQADNRLGVLITAHPLAGGEAHQQFLSFGTKAHLSWAPDADTGKRIVKIPDGAGQPLPRNSNWALFRQSLLDCDPKIAEVFTDDISPLDGIWVHTALVPEPAERKGFGAKTGEAAEEERKGSGLVPIVTEVKEGGKPWEGGGGIPEEGAPVVVVAPPVAKVAGTIKPRVLGKPAAPVAPVVEEAAAEGDDTVIQAAVNGAAPILGGLAKGKTISTLQLRTQIFKAVTAAEGAEMGQAVQNLLIDANMLASVLGELGFAVNNGVVGAA